jgi:regulator of cell morphogenesis and NO signaling
MFSPEEGHLDPASLPSILFQGNSVFVSYYEHIDFSRVDDHDLLDFIESRQHAFTRNMLDLIILNLRSAIRKNPPEHIGLGQVVQLLEALQMKIEQLIRLQEKNLFPFLRKLMEVYQRKQAFRFLKINLTESCLKEIRAEHERILDMLLRMRNVTNHFRPPLYADEGLKLCYAELKEFTEDLTLQLYREDQFLLPRIATLELKVLNRSDQEDAINYGHGGDA